jgi:hypothetical protein
VELVLEDLERIEHCAGPVADAGVQAPTGNDKKRKSAACFLIAYPNVTLLIKRH